MQRAGACDGCAMALLFSAIQHLDWLSHRVMPAEALQLMWLSSSPSGLFVALPLAREQGQVSQSL